MSHTLKSLAAFSLMEALIALSILAVMLAFALPGLRQLLVRSEDDMLMQGLLQTLSAARQASQSRHTAIAVCHSTNQAACSGSWDDGSIIFFNENEDGVVRGREQIMQTVLYHPHRGRIHWRLFPANREYLLFKPDGWLQTMNGTFWYCRVSGSRPVWAIVLNQSGMARPVLPDKNGEIKDSDGRQLECA